MSDSWLGLFEWCEATAVGSGIRESLWLFPVIEAVHLLGLCILGGSILVVDLRMLGSGLRHQPVASIAREAKPWLLASLAVMIATGTSLFLSEAVKCYYSPAFWTKMSTLPVALLFTLTVRQRVALASVEATRTTRLVGAASLTLWFIVAAAGRWIGFS
jgi:hypothetical protein